VARENGAVLQALSRTGVAVFPADDEHSPIWRQLANGYPKIDFAASGKARVTGQAQWLAEPTPHWVLTINTPEGEIGASLHMAGEHNVRNALAATAAALGAGASPSAIATGLSGFEPVKGRSQLHAASLNGRAITLVDDSYNANPDSVRAAIDMLAGLPGPHWLVLGDMGEVGTQGPAFHAEVGDYARVRGIEHVWTAGELCAHVAAAFDGDARHFNSAAEMVVALSNPSVAPDAASVLVKGSRFMKMEQVVHLLCGGAHAA
jgi:UDP-N-acetylmuramyl pentapeptide synthase